MSTAAAYQQVSVLSSLPEDNLNHECQKYVPHSWKPQQCRECGGSWNLHRNITTEQVASAIYCTAENEATEVLPNQVYLGGMKSAINRKFLEEHNITAILTCATGLEAFFPRFGEEIREIRRELGAENVLSLQLLDWEYQDITRSARRAVVFIDDVLSRGGRVIVHCAQGKSRSAAIIIAYLILRRAMSFDDALNFVQSRRPIVQPNPGFVCQLRAMSQLHRNSIEC
mmetsp:Transcript_15573/g.25794  ORF Transcript_15573/g.25794 Transcript_15573/m.25794 type:complete len:227 (-) Transcript_15573:323-1003(-)|eukprot:CAMPEP_0184656692 /NCGR_PEP_ID=MMETSP0308-20130426/16686_1 /TAXON_ID=38269 /ORGANISM="Gloeochaete witrockiana, Strain SAG 46.84" /LENGTH=226 /DNA_ID=CAMNT_0027093929 /DNA_START=100 /DNA_END=780 /DNA_ORIENTATION=+